MVRGLGLAVLSLFFISSCYAQPLPPPEKIKHARPEDPINPHLPRLVRHALIGQGKSVYEFQAGILDVIFEEGTVDGFFIEENYHGCTLHRFSLYAFEPRDGKTNQLYIDQAFFQRFRTRIKDLPEGYIFQPPGYTEEETAEIFRAADQLLAAYNVLQREPTDKVIRHLDPRGPYNSLLAKGLALEPRCRQSEDKLAPEMMKKFMP